ncbi:MAG TPA: adenine deaminase C-terminal domain-containing protein, partial [Chitinophagales bacterium]|nr:adenine deaminase C-terminal domain-containing protein [Chitinophagales bacterium]
ECFTYDEGLFKLKHGMKILIREGSSARNFEALFPLIDEFPDSVMLCTDDTHPDDLIKGHINLLVKRALAKGLDLFNVLRAASFNPKEHYKLKYGLLQRGHSADFVAVDNLTDFNVISTYIGGEKVAGRGESFLSHQAVEPINNFASSPKSPQDFHVDIPEKLRVIKALDGQLITEEAIVESTNGLVGKDILKITVVNRYSNTEPAVAFINGFGLKHGAIASSVAHDSHNVIAVGADDEAICKAVNQVIFHQGGLAVCDGENVWSLPLPVAGLMSMDDAKTVGEKYQTLDRKAKELGCTLRAPFMTASFMALLVIPKLKLSDRGLFDAVNFQFVSVATD